MVSVCAAAFQRPQFGKGVDRPIRSGEAGSGLLRRYGKGRVILRHDLIGGCPKQPEHQKCDKQNTGYRASDNGKDTLAAGVRDNSVGLSIEIHPQTGHILNVVVWHNAPSF